LAISAERTYVGTRAPEIGAHFEIRRELNVHTSIRPAFVLILILAGRGLAQSTQPAPTPAIPPIEDRQLYYQFFNYLQGLVNNMHAAQAANGQNSAALSQQMAALLQVDVKDLPLVIASMQQVTQAYAKLDADERTGVYTLPKNTPPPTPAQLATIFQFRRDGLTVDGFLSLFLQLSQASWSGLHGYIVGAYKNTIYKP